MGHSLVLAFSDRRVLVISTWYLTIRGRGESARVVFTMLGIFVLLTIVMAIGLFLAKGHGVVALSIPDPRQATPPLLTAMYHMLTASMKGLVALSGLEAMSNGIQFVIDEDIALVKWGKKHLPQLNKLCGNFIAASQALAALCRPHFLFYGGSYHGFPGIFCTALQRLRRHPGKVLVGNLAFIGFSQISGRMYSCTGRTRSWRLPYWHPLR